ncbi:MAG: serine hydrolase [Acidobacteria bacterium]|nr:serine hydrolase [Acidobacteriota bacterium]
MKRYSALLALWAVMLGTLALPADQAKKSAVVSYFPARDAWESRPPTELGLNPEKLDAAVQYSIKNQNQNTKNLAEDILNTFRNEAPYNKLIGPTQERTGANGLVIRHGYVAAEWGDTKRADMTFSVTKTFLSTVVGLAYTRGLIKDLKTPVAQSMPSGVDLFTSEHNRTITWEHLLRQTSDWSGMLWDKPDWADRPAAGQPPEEWPKRVMHEPGTFYKYNDTRVNVLALAALHVWKRPLPDVLRELVMDPIGASGTWHWEAYENAWVTIDGRRMQSVTGGGHFGGGMFISAWDMARLGYLFLNDGRWGGKTVVPKSWIDLARTPGPANTAYGFMNWFLNTPEPVTNGRPGRQMYSAAPPSAVAFRGNGENIIYIDWEHDIVAVVRWVRNANGFITQLMGAIEK